MSASASTTDPAPTRSPAAQPNRPHGVSLPSGSWLDLGLAAAIAAAVALVWAHRRRRYTRRPLSADLRLTDPDLAPMPPVVTQIRRGLRRATNVAARHEDSPDTDALDLLAADNDQLDSAGLVDVRPSHGDTGSPGDALDADDLDTRVLVPDDEDLVGEDESEQGSAEHGGDNPTDPHLLAVPRPAVPSLVHPLSAVWPPAGLGARRGTVGAARYHQYCREAAGVARGPDHHRAAHSARDRLTVRAGRPAGWP